MFKKIFLIIVSVTIVSTALLALIGGLAIGQRIIVDPIGISDINNNRPLILWEVDTHQTNFGIPFIFSATYSHSPYDLHLKVIDHDLNTSHVLINRVEVTSSDGRLQNNAYKKTAATMDFRHNYIGDHGETKNEVAKKAIIVLPGCFTLADEFDVRIFGSRLTPSGEAREFSAIAKIVMHDETIFTTHRKLNRMKGP